MSEEERRSPQALLEQYKLYVEMADRVTSRRAEANKLYVSLLTGLLALIAVVVDLPTNEALQTAILLAVGVGGIGLCIIWQVNVRSYRQLNSAKYKVIQELEELLPFAGYKREWTIVNDPKNRTYRRVTTVEQALPWLYAIPFLALLVYFLYHLLS